MLLSVAQSAEEPLFFLFKQLLNPPTYKCSCKAIIESIISTELNGKSYTIFDDEVTKFF